MEDPTELTTEETVLDFELEILLGLLLDDNELLEDGATLVTLEEAIVAQTPRLFQAFACAQPTPGS